MCDSIFDYIKEIGTGSYGIVKLIKHKKTGQLLAFKIINKKVNVNEFDLHSQVSQHPNIIKVYYYYSPDEIRLAGFLMEFAPNGDLFRLVRRRTKLTEPDARLIFMQLISAVDHCHKNNISHRDIKLENILINQNIIKLTDFGYACRIDDPDIKKRVGTMTYIAPEILLDTESDLIKSDIWACGVVLYILVCGQYPFEWGEDPDINTPESHKHITHNILNLKYTLPEHLSEECKDLIKQIFVINPTDRISIHKIWNSKWLNMDVIFD
jgi:serine/threonine protein kinase